MTGGNVYKLLSESSDIQNILAKYPVKFTGFYKDTIDFYKDVDCVVCPIVFGTGINVKMIEAMSFGLPVLTTECGIKGVVSESPYHHFKDQAELLDGLWELFSKETKIKSLIRTSKDIFNDFYTKNAHRFDSCFKEGKKMNDIKHLCSGCGICVGICSANALTMELNADGFYRPNRNNKCINCGLCNAICPFKKIATQPNNETVDTVFGSYHIIFAAYSKDKTIRKASSTGGFIRTFLSYYANQFDGVIVLTETDNPLKPQVDCLDKSDDILNKITKSIYFHVEFSQAVKI